MLVALVRPVLAAVKVPVRALCPPPRITEPKVAVPVTALTVPSLKIESLPVIFSVNATDAVLVVRFPFWSSFNNHLRAYCGVSCDRTGGPDTPNQHIGSARREHNATAGDGWQTRLPRRRRGSQGHGVRLRIDRRRDRNAVTAGRNRPFKFSARCAAARSLAQR